MNSNETIAKLYQFVAKLLLVLEEELDQLKLDKSKNTINTKQTITTMLNKLAQTTAQLNKLSQNEKKAYHIKDSDQEIINQFLDKYCNNNANKE
ncbi:MAG: hypothetical protein AB8B67_03375 [Rickettsiaceae bacterium]